jgi:hypothetical protein
MKDSQLNCDQVVDSFSVKRVYWAGSGNDPIVQHTAYPHGAPAGAVVAPEAVVLAPAAAVVSAAVVVRAAVVAPAAAVVAAAVVAPAGAVVAAFVVAGTVVPPA